MLKKKPSVDKTKLVETLSWYVKKHWMKRLMIE